LSSASIGQVHKAKLTAKYGGRTVAVKIMHPNAEDLFRNDLKVFRTLCTVALPGWEPILREFETQIMTEFDYGNEANNLQLVRANVARSPYANKVRVPEPMINLCSKNLLVMEYLSGKKMATAIEDRLAAILGGDVQMARKVLQAKQRAVFESRDAGTKAKGYLHELSDIIGENDDGLSMRQRTTKALELMLMVRSARRTLSLLLDATGHQIFNDGLYNGDPHPGNILVLDCGRLGLIDYGQTRSLSRDDRLALAKVVAALGKQCTSAREVSDAMRKFGFLSRDANEENMAHFGELYFDSDERGRTLGHATPQKYLMHLNANDPMLVIPDPAVFVARTSFLYRGLGSLLQQHLRTSHHWRKHALLALATEGEGRSLYNLGLTPPR
jgi:aarF domain-containing kinase